MLMRVAIFDVIGLSGGRRRRARVADLVFDRRFGRQKMKGMSAQPGELH
jgi:hypothetical protein